MALGYKRLTSTGWRSAAIAWVYEKDATLKGVHRVALDQWLRASHSIPIAIWIARECGAILGILDRCGVLDREAARKGKDLLVQIVAMLTRMIERGTGSRR